MYEIINSDWLLFTSSKFFMSQDELNNLYKKGVIDRSVVIAGDYGKDYIYTYKGELITRFYKDNTRTFSSQKTSVNIDYKFVFVE